MKPPSDFILTKTDPIHQTANSKVFLGTYEGKEAITKVFPLEFPSESIQRSYQKDHHVSSLLYEKYPDNFSEPLKFFNNQNKLFVIKTFEGISFSKLIEEQKKMDLKTFLRLAISVCENLQLIHQQNVIHCDIKPQNILYNKKNEKIIIIDSESSFLVSLKNPKVPYAERGKSKSNQI